MRLHGLFACLTSSIRSAHAAVMQQSNRAQAFAIVVAMSSCEVALELHFLPTSVAFLAKRAAACLNVFWSDPSQLVQVSIDTACSSALVGAHMAAQHLQAHAGSALSAGVNLMLAEHTTAATQVAGMLSAEGRCKTLDAAADGYVRAEACVVLRLDAMTIGRRNAVGVVLVKGTHVNQVRLPLESAGVAFALLAQVRQEVYSGSC